MTNERSAAERIAAAEERRAKAGREIARLQAEIQAVSARSAALRGEIDGPLPAEARAMIEAAEKQTAEAKVRAEALREATRKAEFRAMAAGFRHVAAIAPITTEAFGEVLRECADKLKPEQFSEIRRVLKAYDAMVSAARMAQALDDPRVH